MERRVRKKRQSGDWRSRETVGEAAGGAVIGRQSHVGEQAGETVRGRSGPDAETNGGVRAGDVGEARAGARGDAATAGLGLAEGSDPDAASEMDARGQSAEGYRVDSLGEAATGGKGPIGGASLRALCRASTVGEGRGAGRRRGHGARAASLVMCKGESLLNRPYGTCCSQISVPALPPPQQAVFAYWGPGCVPG